MMLAMDVGKRAVGCSAWRDGVLRDALLVSGADRIFRDGPEVWRRTAEAVARYFRGIPIDEIVFERPGAYRSDIPSRTLDIQDLIAVAAWTCALFPDAKYVAYWPREWKGTVKAEVCCARARGRLTPEEIARVQLPSASRAHNLWDSVGLGLYHLGRFAPTKVFARG